jgi:phospholipase/carboxylesterase
MIQLWSFTSFSSRKPARYRAGDMSADTLEYLSRPSVGPPDGLVVLFHGRGADERDLYPLFDVLDPGRRLFGLTPRGPLQLPPGGAHWYAVREIGYPDPMTFRGSYARVGAWVNAIGEETGIGPDRTVLGGFSQGAVMTFALGLGPGRPHPAGLIALSGFIPTVPGFELDLTPPLPRVAIGHGTLDPVISVEWSREAARVLADAGADVGYREAPHMAHSIDPVALRELPSWLSAVLPPQS